MDLLKRLQVVDRGPDFASVVRPERNQLCDGPTVPGDDEALPRLHALQKPRQMRFRFECVDFGHVAAFVTPCGGATDPVALGPAAVRTRDPAGTARGR